MAPAAAGGPVAQTVSTMSWLSGVDCRPDRTCLGAGEQSQVGAIGVLTPSGVGPVRRVRGTRGLSTISCPPAGNCIAVGTGSGGGGVVVRVGRDGIPLAVYPVEGATELYDVDCPSPERCVATGARRITMPYDAHEGGSISVRVFVVLTNGAPGPAQRYPRSFRSVTAVDCLTLTRCVAVGSRVMVVLSGDGGSWTATAGVPAGSAGADDISCPTPSACYATAYGAISTPEGSFAVPAIQQVSADGVPGTKRVLSDRSASLLGISCVADWTCTVVGLDNTTGQGMAIGVTRSGPPVLTNWDNSNWFSDVSCISAGVCGLVGTAAGSPQLPVWAWKG